MKNKGSIATIIGLFLYAVFTFGLFLHQSEPSLSILVGEHPSRLAKGVPFLAGEKINFEITSLHDGLGIIAIRFQTYRRINDDILTFRLKPKGAAAWTYESNYKTDQFQDHELFPFGFPLQPDSSNKKYEIELESLTGRDGNYVSVDSTNPAVVSKYHLPAKGDRSITMSNILLGLKKIINLLSNSSSVFPILVYLSPLLVFLINSPISLAVPLILITAQHFLNLSRPYHWELTLILAWLTYLIVTKASYRISIALSILGAFNLIARVLENDSLGIDQAAIWLYYSLILVVIQIKVRFSD